jgi:hypothetical protein
MPLVDPTAKQLSFQKYYHYQPFCRDHLTTLLRDKKLFFSDPDTFNDPWDCKPWYDYRPMLEDPVKREEMIAFLRCLVSPEMLANPLRAVYEDSLRRDDDALIKDVETYSRGLGEQIRKRRFYCLSVLPDSTLMWSHYSANHRGICLEFDKNGSAQESDNLPERPAFSEGWRWLVWDGEGTGLDKGSRMAGIPGLSDGD